MNNMINMIWVERRKAVRSRIPLWTAVFSMLLPVVIALMILISRNPEISRKLGVISAKADLIGFSTTNWESFMVLTAQLVATAGFFMFIVILSWIFGREFADQTVKDLLAVPVPRSTILVAKFIVYAVWSMAMIFLILFVSLLMGMAVQLPGADINVVWEGIVLVLITVLFVILVVVPFALLASVGRGYLLPMSLAVVTLILANIAIALGWGDLFPWSIPGLFSQNKNLVGSAGYLVVAATGLLGWWATDQWWKKADQAR
ncbi:MAG: ABC transporter permease subunit [Leptolinea sp.]|jgi:ABC-2 type transport system permease protein|nr:ABC transporter permease subunit [Leptolinea sp.]